ncbi:copper amine oxidase N-terminal domain-containing protein [Paenibacillus sp. IB182496]|uniref:Copper amine oxidase N-terminal domain-containing protein n=1 Tax=Paenibacillus sabuli TaxID=2772509 RepID=A0A927GTE4_9BACL|nr:copper amine oxidase N-terminal domain-containing protein [Paenibacillus sabuli]MBD2847739.1 copper amine oxidase N-terminal domain-containing protein [Paenibacillus sabuli]
MKFKKLVAPVLSLSLLVPAIGVVGSASAAEMEASTETKSVELRATLDHLLSEHFVLATTSMMKLYDGAPDAAAAQAALEQNAADMKPAIASVYGDAGAAEFDRIFSAHNSYTEEFVEAELADDEDARQEAEDELEEFVQEFGDFLGTATEGNLPASAAKDVLRKHENQVIEVFDHYASGEYGQAYGAFREGLGDMFDISDALSQAIAEQFPDVFDGTKPNTPAGDLRSTLNHLAAEHFALAVLSMQKGLDESEDYNVILSTQDANTADFSAAIASIYGEAGGEQFMAIWNTNHIEAQEAIVEATLEGDADAIDDARDRLDVFAENIGSFLDTATDSNLPEAAAVEAVMMHENQVLDTFDSYNEKAFFETYDNFREGYAFVFGIGATLGKAIVMQDPTEFTGVPEGPVFPPSAPPADQPIMSIWLQVNSTTFFVDGEEMMSDVAPMNVDGTTYVSLRTMADVLNAQIEWNRSNEMVITYTNGDTIVVQAGSETAVVNGVQEPLEAPVFIEQGRTQVPLRFVAEHFGWDIEWEPSDWSITLTQQM